jgi:DNA (cytosine-5)-methyltransferase 1
MPYALVTMNGLTIHDAALALGVSIDTIRRWEKKGLIKSTRNNLNHRTFNLDELNRVKLKYSSSEDVGEFKVLKSKPTKYTAIELFSGCGGMALGFENAGLNTRMLVEIDKNAVATLRANRPNWNVIDSDISKVSFHEFKDKIDVLAGGFPCQAFSYAGKGLGFGETRGTLFFELLRAAKEINPKIVVGENVRGLIKHDGGRTLATMIHSLKESGYRVVYHMVRAQFLDVPQKRERLILLGVREDLDLPHLFPKEKDYTLSLRQALKAVPKSKGYEYSEKKHKIMSLIPEGGYWRDLSDKLQREFMGASYFHTGGKTGMARRLSMDEPSLTLTCNPAQKQTERCHPKETRPLNVREYARIQTFPDEWEFSGAVSSQYKQIGNAVPVNLGYHIGRCVMQMLSNNTNHKEYIIKTEDDNMASLSVKKPQLEFKL